MRFWSFQAGIALAVIVVLAAVSGPACGSSTTSGPGTGGADLVCEAPAGNAGKAWCQLATLGPGGCQLGFGVPCIGMNIGGGIEWVTATCANGICTCQSGNLVTCTCAMGDAGDPCVTGISCCPYD